MSAPWLAEVEQRGLDHAIAVAVPEHLAEVRGRVVDQAQRTMAALPPVLVGRALVVPSGLLARLGGERTQDPSTLARETERVDRAAVAAVLAQERALGRRPREMAHNNPGYDVLSRDPITDELVFIAVKGRAVGGDTVTVSKNHVLTALNKPEAFILALVAVAADDSTDLRYLASPFRGDQDTLFDITSVTFDWAGLWDRAEPPEAPEHPPVEHWIELMVERLAAQFSPREIVLFGSQARGDATVDSDVDLLVVFDEVDDRDAAAVRMRDAVADMPVAKDIVVATPAEIERRGHLVGTLLRPALTDGKRVYARS